MSDDKKLFNPKEAFAIPPPFEPYTLSDGSEVYIYGCSIQAVSDITRAAHRFAESKHIPEGSEKAAVIGLRAQVAQVANTVFAAPDHRSAPAFSGRSDELWKDPAWRGPVAEMCSISDALTYHKQTLGGKVRRALQLIGENVESIGKDVTSRNAKATRERLARLHAVIQEIAAADLSKPSLEGLPNVDGQ